MQKNMSSKITNLFKQKKSKNQFDAVIDIQSFSSFYSQQIQWIKEHIEYENDMDQNLDKNNKVLVRFDISQYVSNFDKYFKDQNLYKFKAEDLFILVLIILDPPSDTISLISKENRRKLCSGILFNIALNIDLKLADLIKNYYRLINNLNEGTTSQSKDAILTFFKESIELVDKQYDNLKESTDVYKKKPIIEAPELLTELLKSFYINNDKDLNKLMKKSKSLNFIFSILLYIILFIFLVIYRLGINNFFSNQSETFKYPLFTFILISILVVITLIHIILFTRSVIRKKYVLRSLRNIIRYFNIPHNVLETYFKNKFKFDIKKLR